MAKPNQTCETCWCFYFSATSQCRLNPPKSISANETPVYTETTKDAWCSHYQLDRTKKYGKTIK